MDFLYELSRFKVHTSKFMHSTFINVNINNDEWRINYAIDTEQKFKTSMD